MNIALLGYPEIQEGNFYNGIAKVVYQMTCYFQNRGDKVVHYHLFSKEQYLGLNAFLLDNQVDVAIWHMSTLKLKGSINLPCPLICMWHNDPLGRLSNYATVFCQKYSVRGLGAKLIQTKIASYALNFFHDLLSAIMFTIVVHSADRMVLLSEGFKKDFVPAYLYPKKVVAIPNGVELEQEKMGGEKNNSVIYVGRLRKEKRLDYLLQAWKKVEENVNDWNLLIVGHGPDVERYQQLAKDINIHRCKWLGWQNDTTRFLKTSKIQVLTSEYEGFPCVLLEASKYGVVPVIYNSFASAADIIQDDVNGKLIHPFDIDAFANSIIDLINHPDRLKRMADNAEENAKRFEISSIMSKWDTLIDDVLKENKP